MYTILTKQTKKVFPAKQQKVIFYPLIQHIGVIGALSDGINTKSYRALFDLQKKKTVIAEILDNGDIFSGNIIQEIHHSEELLDSEYINILYNTYSQNANPTTLLTMMTNPFKQILPYPLLAKIDNTLYSSIHKNKILNTNFGL